jgi:hypothetical protein
MDGDGVPQPARRHSAALLRVARTVRRLTDRLLPRHRAKGGPGPETGSEIAGRVRAEPHPRYTAGRCTGTAREPTACRSWPWRTDRGKGSRHWASREPAPKPRHREPAPTDKGSPVAALCDPAFVAEPVHGSRAPGGGFGQPGRTADACRRRSCPRVKGRSRRPCRSISPIPDQFLDVRQRDPH